MCASATIDASLTVAVVTREVNVNELESFTTRYSVNVTAGNTATRNRTVIVRDTTKPEITLAGTAVVEQEAKVQYVDLGVSASDTLDASLTVSVDTSAMNVNAVGSYTVTYSVSDTAGNTTIATRTVIVRDTTKPEITLAGAAVVEQEAKVPYVDLGASASDTLDAGLTVAVETGRATGRGGG